IQDLGYLKNPQEVEFFPETFPTLLKLQEQFLLFIITNQSGISKVITSANEVKLVNDYIVEALKTNGIIISAVFCCPHTNEDNCACKKPKPYFIHQAAELYHLSLDDSYLIGDHPSDMECGLNAGVTPIYVLTGHGEKHKTELNSECIICGNIAEAAKCILETQTINVL
ncbi:MAG TPA: HAD-IIIA family hydrolase, partial [Paludibacter sp.]|nr:HAD-IIIA family hydrolase [Paludibacter sp.]